MLFICLECNHISMGTNDSTIGVILMRAYNRIKIEPELLLALKHGNGYTDKDISEIFGCSPNTIGNIRRKYNIPSLVNNWTEGEINILNRLYPINGSNISELLQNHDKLSIHQEAHRLGIKSLDNGRFKNGEVPWNKGYGEYMEGKNNPFYGKSHTDEARRRMSKIAKQKYASGERVHNMKGKHRSMETKKKISKSLIGHISWSKGLTSEKDDRILSGENHWNWQGGITEKNYHLRCLLACELNRWSKKIYNRNKYTCQVCRRVGMELNAHHIKPFSDIIKEYDIITRDEALNCKELWDINNGICLCYDCHMWIHHKSAIPNIVCINDGL